jgi:HlyD family secretion protein
MKRPLRIADKVFASRFLRRRGVLAALALPVIAVAIVLVLSGSSNGPAYLTASVERGDITSFVSATGTLTPVGQVQVGSQLSGQVGEVLVDFNDEVARDQPLARIDPEGFEATVREAEAGLEIAEASMLMQEAALSKAEADLVTAQATQVVRTAETESARAQREEAEAQLGRAQALAREAAISGSDVDRAQARAESASAMLRAAETQELVGDASTQSAEAAVKMSLAGLQNAVAEVKRRSAALERAKVDLQRTTIRAPIDGIVINRNIESGQTVAASLEAPTLFTLASDLRHMEVYAQVDQADIGRITVGQPVAFAVDAYPDRVFQGAVKQIRKAPQIVQNVVTYTVIVSADNAELLLLPGMTAILRIVITEMHDVMKVPNAALRFRPAEEIAAPVESRARSGELGLPDRGTPALIWMLEDGELVPSVVGYEEGDATVSAVVSGELTAGSQVVVGVATEAEAAFGLRLGQ